MQNRVKTLEAGQFAFKPLLPESLEKDQGDAVGEVKRSSFGIEHGNAQPGGSIPFQQSFWQAGRFAAKDEVIAVGEGDFGVKLGTVRFDEP